jgi:hypothetical protein
VRGWWRRRRCHNRNPSLTSAFDRNRSLPCHNHAARCWQTATIAILMMQVGLAQGQRIGHASAPRECTKRNTNLLPSGPTCEPALRRPAVPTLHSTDHKDGPIVKSRTQQMLHAHSLIHTMAEGCTPVDTHHSCTRIAARAVRIGKENRRCSSFRRVFHEIVLLIFKQNSQGLGSEKNKPRQREP